MPTLLELDLSYNQINEISNGGVSNLLSVKTIYLNDNKLKQMFPVSMAVNTLHLENNRIQSIGSNMFPMINAVLVVHLDNNNISQLDDNSFRQCLSLNTLTLKGNRLNEIPQRALAPLTSLQKLDLSFNQLKNLGMLLNCFLFCFVFSLLLLLLSQSTFLPDHLILFIRFINTIITCFFSNHSL